MKLDIGVYVRTQEGYIAKIIDELYDFEGDSLKSYRSHWITNNNNVMHIPTNKENEWYIKASHNIIDLIEVGDYVNGEYMQEHYLQHNRIEHTYNSYWYENDIKEILTHEQYEANAYTVKEMQDEKDN